MHALTLDHLSGGRVMLGLGVSGPQVVEGWYGRPFAKPLARTREYVDDRAPGAAARGAGDERRAALPPPLQRRGRVGLGKPLKPITHPLRADLPIFLGAEGPKNVALAAEIADGWLPLYYSPYRPEVYADRSTAMPDGFEIAVNVTVIVDRRRRRTGCWPVKATLGFYIGGMGAKRRNFHTELMARMGFEDEAHKIQDLFFEGKRDEAILAVPDEFADEISLVGPRSASRSGSRRGARRPSRRCSSAAATPRPCSSSPTSPADGPLHRRRQCGEPPVGEGPPVGDV